MGQAPTAHLNGAHPAQLSEGDGALADKVAAVEQARERLGRDVELMQTELRATVGVTMEKTLWKALTVGAGVLAGVIMRKGLNAAWRKTRHQDPPTDPAQPTGWGEAITWAAASGVGVGVARLIAARGAAAGWTKAMGTTPPGVSAAA